VGCSARGVIHGRKDESRKRLGQHSARVWNPDKCLRAEFPVTALQEVEWTYASHAVASPQPKFILRAIIRLASLPEGLLARWEWGKGRSSYIRVYILKRDNEADVYQQLAAMADLRDEQR
jgi:hypothetical protein